jgi:phage-related protein
VPPSTAPKGSSSSSARRSAPEAAYQAFDGGAASALYTGFQPSPEGTGKANGMEGHKAAGPMSSAKAPHRPASSGSATVQQASEFTSELVQNLAAGSGKPKKKKKIGDIKKIAKKGVKGGAKKLPHAAKIKKSFGKYGPDVDNIQAHIGGRAGEAAQELKAEAYAFGSHIAFTERPTIEIAAHEAAHAVGQMYGEGPPGGVGKPGDRWEKSADRIARKAKSGQDAEAEIEKMLGNKAAAGPKESAQGLGGFAESLQLHATAAAGDFLGKGYFEQGNDWSTLESGMSTGLESEESTRHQNVPVIRETMGPSAEEAAPERTLDGEQTAQNVPAGADGPPAPPPEIADTPQPDGAPAPVRPRVVAQSPDVDEEALVRDFKGNLDAADTGIDPVNTDPGPDPPVNLAGNSDPVQADEQAVDTQTEGERARLEAMRAVDEGPGPEQVQPLVIAEEHNVEAFDLPQLNTLEKPPSLDEYMSKVPTDVQSLTDQLAKTDMEAGLAEAQAKLDKAQSDRETSQNAAISEAESENQALIEQANRDQEAEVTKARGDIDAQRASTKREQDAAVREMNTTSERERGKIRRDVEARVAQDEAKIQSEFDTAQNQADTQKRSADADADREKREAEAKGEDDGGWFGWIGDAISSAFDAFADALNSIVDGLISAVGALIDAAKAAATALIDACRDFVVAALEGFGELLKGLVDNLLGDIFPGLAAALTDFIDSAVDLAVSAVNAIADALKDGINALLDGLKGAITAALEAYRAAINAAIAIAQAVVTGDWAELARKMLEAALQLAGIDPGEFMGMVGSAMDSIDSIIDDPGGFIGNVIDAVGTGFGQFADNFLGHLQNGFFEWLAGPLGGAGITLPSNWDLEGIFGLVMQVLGLTQDGIRGIITEEFGETAGALFDYAWRYIGALISGGIEGLWGEIQGDLSNLWGMVVDGIKDWLVETIVTQAVIRIASMFNPAGALIQAIMAVWDVVTWLRDNVQRIYGVISAVVEGMAGLVAGEVAPVANLVEGQLANLIAPAIDLLAGLLGLDGLADRIQEIIEGIRETVRNAIKSLIARVRSMFDEEGGDEQTPEDLPGDPEWQEFVATLGERQAFTATEPGAGGQTEGHHVWITESGGQLDAMVASGTPMPIMGRLDGWQADLATRVPDPTRQAIVDAAINEARSGMTALQVLLDQAEAETDEAARARLRASILAKEVEVSAPLGIVFGEFAADFDVPMVAPGPTVPGIAVSAGPTFQISNVPSSEVFLARTATRGLDASTASSILMDYYVAMKSGDGSARETASERVISALEASGHVESGEGVRFWSGTKDIAADEAEANGGRTLEQDVGMFFDGLNFGQPWSDLTELWNALSAGLARNCKGKVMAHQYRGVRGASVFNTKEMPELVTLLDDGAVTEVEVIVYWKKAGTDGLPIWGDPTSKRNPELVQKETLSFTDSASLQGFASSSTWDYPETSPDTTCVM